jgi:hypothetical protein
LQWWGVYTGKNVTAANAATHFEQVSNAVAANRCTFCTSGLSVSGR